MSNYLRWNYRRHMQLQPSPGIQSQFHSGKRCLLYIHVPFCESLCPFCSFHRVKLNHQLARRYFEALRQEIHFYHNAGFEFSDVYVGGGTPTVLPEQLTETLDLVRRLFEVNHISVETNPNHLHQELFDQLQRAGVNRLSVGVQSLEDSLLMEMERYQPYGSAGEILKRLKLTQGQFDTFNVDMIFNFPHQAMDSLIKGIELLKEIEVDQITLYPLMPAITTQKAMSKQIGMVEFEREPRMYKEIWETLKPEYQPDTAWSFARYPVAAIDEYIVDHDEYVGIGSGSFSYLDGVIYSNSFSINRYIELTKQARSGVMASHQLTLSEQVKYAFLLKLFGLSMNKAKMQRKFGDAYQRLLHKELKFFKWLGVIDETSDEYRLSQEGMYYWVMMMREFFIGVNNLRMQMGTQLGEKRLGRN
ncbi:MAG: coproporphyrinogen III oxidase family protein [Pseudomonadota bacterium]